MLRSGVLANIKPSRSNGLSDGAVRSRIESRFFRSAIARYELRVHNESKIAVAAVELEIPSVITVTAIGQSTPVTYTTTKTGDRIVGIKWQVDVAPSKYLALPFTATNPGMAMDVHWNVHEHLADGSVVEWNDQPNATEKASVTKIG